MVSCYHRLTKAASIQCSQGTTVVIFRCHCRVAGKATPIQLIPSEARSLLGFYWLYMASLQASITLFCLSTVSQAPSPAPGISNRVDYLHEEPQQLQVSSCAVLDSFVELFFVTYKIVTFSWLEAAGSFCFHHRQHRLWTIYQLTLSFRSITSVFQSKRF